MTGRETLLDTIETLRDQRDMLYTASVQPRRDVARARKALAEERYAAAEDMLDDAQIALDHLWVLYGEQVGQ